MAVKKIEKATRLWSIRDIVLKLFRIQKPKRKASVIDVSVTDVKRQYLASGPSILLIREQFVALTRSTLRVI